MKIRNFFVSNSSSSSFIVIGNSNKPIKLEHNCITTRKEPALDLSKEKHVSYDFGWGPEKVTDIHSRIAFAMLQCHYTSKRKESNTTEKYMALNGWETDWGKMLIKLLKTESGILLIWKLPYYSYIDHASCASEGSNTEIFKNCETLKKFIYCPDSTIYLNNDNDGSEEFYKIEEKLTGRKIYY